MAAITADTQEVPIIVLKHEGNLLTVYAGIGDVAVKEKDKVSRSQLLGKIRPGNPPYIHFEVRRGFEALDPMEFLIKIYCYNSIFTSFLAAKSTKIAKPHALIWHPSSLAIQ